MRTIFIAAAALAAVIALPAAAVARPGFVTTSLNLRAGPSVDFPAVDTVPAGAEVNVHGCLAGYEWCDVSFSGDRGWVDGDYLQLIANGRRVLIIDYGPEIDFPIVSFDVGAYWHRYYSDRDFFGRLGYWENHYEALHRGHEFTGEGEHGRYGHERHRERYGTAGEGGREHYGHENRHEQYGTTGQNRHEHYGPEDRGTYGNNGRGEHEHHRDRHGMESNGVGGRGEGRYFGHGRGGKGPGGPHAMHQEHGAETTGAAPHSAAGAGPMAAPQIQGRGHGGGAARGGLGGAVGGAPGGGEGGHGGGQGRDH